MRCGITYDTGFLSGTSSTHEPFEPDRVAREMQIIHDDLHCAAVRVTGGDPERLDIAATHAAAAGLEVWFSPFTYNLTTDELLALLADCAERAERLRRGGAEVVFLTGSELTLCTTGFVPGDTLVERLGVFSTPERVRAALADVPARINDFLGKAVAVVRERFEGKISYASLPFEGVDWAPFDFVATDGGYRSAEIANLYQQGIRTLVAQGKPVAITEFGCTTHRGAADLGPRGDSIVEWDEVTGRASKLVGEPVRDEAEQAQCLRELLDILCTEGVDIAFANTFARYDLPHRPDPRDDFDMASYGVVKVLEDRFGETYPDMKWEPKQAFTTLATYYQATNADSSR